MTDAYDSNLMWDTARPRPEAQRGADEWPPEAEEASEEIADTFGRPWVND